MSMTPVTITLRANEWTMIAHALHVYMVACDEDDLPIDANRARAMRAYIGKRIEESS